MAGPGVQGLAARGAGVVEMTEHHRRVMTLYSLGWRYSKIAKVTGYSFSGCRKIVLSELAKRIIDGEAAERARRLTAARYEEVIERLGHLLFATEDDVVPDLKLLDRYLRTLMQLAAITIPKLPTRVDITSGGEPLGAIEFGNDLEVFMDTADIIVRNRLGSGRSPDDVIDIEPLAEATSPSSA
jgi:hypothetical protein